MKKKRQDRPEPAQNKDARMRRCLSCGESFPSEWAGERICKRCKQTTTWRAG